MLSEDRTINYAAWLTQARQSLVHEQHISRSRFSADNTAVCFDNISYATTKVLSEQSAEQE